MWRVKCKWVKDIIQVTILRFRLKIKEGHEKIEGNERGRVLERK